MIYGFIYRITNDVNGKFYIGQTQGNVQSRFRRHISDALGKRHLNTHFARALRKYGVRHFHVEQIDIAKSKEELTRKEIEWILKTQAITKGYNETNAEYKSGGNTYMSKTVKEIKAIGKKISEANSHGKNGNSRAIKMMNIKTGEELFFDSVRSAQEKFKIKHHTQITRLCRHVRKGLFLGVWKVAYAEFNYDDDENVYVKRKNVCVGARKILVKDIETGIINTYSSYREFERMNGLKYKSVAVKTTYTIGQKFIFKNRYEITLLN